MELSLFLAKLLGLYILIISAIWLVRRNQVETSLKELLHNRGLLALLGVFSLLFGLSIVIAHPTWELNWRGIVTLIGYVSILQGIMRLGFPNEVLRFASWILQRGFWLPFSISTLLGLYLIYHGFITA